MLLSARFDLEEGTNPSLFQLGRLQCCTGFGPELFPDPSHGHREWWVPQYHPQKGQGQASPSGTYDFPLGLVFFSPLSSPSIHFLFSVADLIFFLCAPRFLYAICTCDVWLRIAMEDASEGSSSQWACQDK